MNTLVTTTMFEGGYFGVTDERRKIQEWGLRSYAELNMRVVLLNTTKVTYWKDIARELMNYDVAAKISSDVILKEPISKVFDFLRTIDEPAAAVSHQRVFNQDEYPNFSNAEIPPYYGIPCFIGNRAFWTHWYEVVDPKLCNYASPEDNFLLSFMNQYYPNTSFDFTDHKCVFHPEHGSRPLGVNTLNQGIEMESKYCGIPSNKINFLK